jgi:hypothetical protein
MADIQNQAKLKEEAVLHFGWGSGKPSRFLSVFTDEVHAHNWARKRHRMSGQAVYITRILTALLPVDTHVFDARGLAKALSIHYEYPEHELVFLHSIPWQSLGLTRSIMDDAPREDLNLPPLPPVRALRDANDKFAVFVQCVEDEKRTAGLAGDLNMEEALAKLSNVWVRAYPAVLKATISALVHALYYQGRNPGRWLTDDPFLELSSILLWTINEMEGKVERLRSAEEIPVLGLPEPERKKKIKKKIVTVRRKRIDPTATCLTVPEDLASPDISRLTLLTD